MSVHVSSEVWAKSEAVGGSRLVLLALADTAHHDGVGWVDQVSLAERTRMSRRQVIRVIAELVESGELEQRKAQRGRRRIGVYRVVVGEIGGLAVDYSRLPFAVDQPFEERRRRDSDDVTSCHSVGGRRRDIRDPDDVTSATSLNLSSKEPSLEPSYSDGPVPGPSLRPPRPRNAVWDVLVEIFGEPPARFKTHFGKVTEELRALLVADGVRDAAVAQDEIRRRRAALAGEWGVGKATKDALVRHWKLAGEVADQGVAGGLSPEQIYDQALESQEGNR